MKLYDSAMAPNPRRVRIFLAEKGIDGARSCRWTSARPRTASRPSSTRTRWAGCPVLELDDGTCIAESVAICRYFEETQPKPPLLGTDAKDRALVEMWQRRMELELFRHVTGSFQNTHDFFKGRIEQVPEYGEVCRKRARASASRGSTASSPAGRSSPASATRSPTSPRSAPIDFGRVVRDPHRARAEEPRALARGGVEPAEREGVAPALALPPWRFVLGTRTQATRAGPTFRRQVQRRRLL